MVQICRLMGELTLDILFLYGIGMSGLTRCRGFTINEA